MMVSGDITKDCLSKDKVDPTVVCNSRVKANSFLCVQCGQLIHGRCAGVKLVTAVFLCRFTARNVKAILESQWIWKKSYEMKWKQ